MFLLLLGSLSLSVKSENCRENPGIHFGAGQLSIPAHHHGICKQEALLQFWSISDLISDLTRATESQTTRGEGERL